MKKRGSAFVWVLAIVIIIVILVIVVLLFVFKSPDSSSNDTVETISETNINKVSITERLTKEDFIKKCNSISEDEKNRNCFQFVAESFGDIELCDKARFVKRCNQKIGTYKVNNIEECEEYSDEKAPQVLKSEREKCYGFAAVYLENFEGCEKVGPILLEIVKQVLQLKLV